MKVFEIVEAKQELELLFEEGEISKEEMVEMSVVVKQELVKKSEGLYAIGTRFNEGIESIDKHIARLQAMRATAVKRQTNFNEFLVAGMTGLGMKKLETTFGNVVMSKSESVNVWDEDLLPRDLMVEKIVPAKKTLKPDKKAIKEALKRKDNDIDGAFIVVKQNIKFK